MDAFYQQIVSLLTTPPGNLVYHIIIAFSLVSPFQNLIPYWNSSQKTVVRRIAFGLAVLILAQIGLFVCSGLSWQGILNQVAILPPLDRAITALSLVWIIWLWNFNRPVRWGDALAGVFSLLIILGAVASLILWPAELVIRPDLNFNGSTISLAWELFSILVVLSGGLLLFMQRPLLWGNAIAMLLLFMLGHLSQVAFFTTGHYAGAVRLAQLAAFPLLMSLPQILAPVSPTATSTASKSRPPYERRRYAVDVKTASTFIKLSTVNDPVQLPGELARSISQAMVADFAYLFALPDHAGSLLMIGGYDLISEKYFAARTMDRERIPLLYHSLMKGQAIRLTETQLDSQDVQNLMHLTGISKPGQVLAVPLMTSGQNPIGALILFSPFSGRNWTNDDQTYLLSLSEGLARILQRAQEDASQKSRSQQSSSDLQNAYRQIDMLQREQQTLINQMESMRQEHEAAIIRERGAVARSGAASLQDETQQIIRQLQTENQQLRQSLNAVQTQAPAATDEQLKITLGELASLEDSLAEANIRIMELEKQVNARPASAPQMDMIVSLVQELRVPMSSLITQVDTLLKDPALFAQQKQISRIKAAGERVRGLMDDLLQTLKAQTVGLELAPETLNLASLIDQAVAEITAELRAKNINLRVDMPDNLPLITADRDALQQIITYMIQNANAVTPQEGNIRLKVRIDDDHSGQAFAQLQVTDQGGGIAPEDMGKLFSALDEPVQGISGVGNPEGLALAKALTEAHQGRFWIDSDRGRSATISAVLPIASVK
ncbi:MAG TPA: ATP-binding protein [Anaerolineaceae bacterium]|nr:ATP-binding protein [Anaerolineaceae bacterium]HPN52358.1 ATP-binding protein [Anaerolineaceae bacterium]